MPTDLPASAVPVHAFREILFWPLSLELSQADATGSTSQAVADSWDHIVRPGSKWARVFDPAEHLAPPVVARQADGGLSKSDLEGLRAWQANALAEGLYFHDFVSDFLFRPPAKCSPANDFRLFRRTDISEICVAWKSLVRTLTVARLNLYVFRTGAAILVLEVFVPAPPPGTITYDCWSLAEVQDFHDLFRRSHVSYTMPGGAPGGVVDRVALIQTKDRKSERTLHISYMSKDAHSRSAEAYAPHGTGKVPRREANILSHWVALLDDALPLKATQPSGKDGTVWQHISDERLPTMLFVSLTNYDALEENIKYYFDNLRRGDFVRLCMADSSGSDDYPCTAEAVADFEERHTYDWFRSWGTRYMTSGYAFVAIGAGTDFDTFVAEHFRRHYFQMGLLLQFEMASLLAKSRAISQAALRFQNHSSGLSSASNANAGFVQFSNDIRRIQQEFLLFVHRFRFTGVSHQAQGIALYDKWRDRLRLPALFDDIEAELRTSTEFQHSEWQRQEAEATKKQQYAAERQADAANKLATIATFTVMLGFPLALLAVDLVHDKQPGLAIGLANKLRSLAHHIPYLDQYPPFETSTSISVRAEIAGILATYTAFMILISSGLVVVSWRSIWALRPSNKGTTHTLPPIRRLYKGVWFLTGILCIFLLLSVLSK